MSVHKHTVPKSKLNRSLSNQTFQKTSSETDTSFNSPLMSESQVLQLQRTIGNQAVMRMLQQQAIQRDSHGKGCNCASCSGGEVDIQTKRIQRADEHEEDIQAKHIQRDSHDKGCRCASCSGGVDIQSKRIQRADEHEEDIQAKRIAHDTGIATQTLQLGRPRSNAISGGTSPFAQTGRSRSNAISGGVSPMVSGPMNGPLSLFDTMKDMISQAVDAVQAVKEFLVSSWEQTISNSEAMKEVAKTITVTDFLSIARLADTPLIQQISLAIAHWSTVSLSDLKPSINDAPKDQKDIVWNDGELMGKLKTKLGNDEYLNMQPLLGVFKEGTTAEDNKSHTRADKADEYIRQHLAPFVGEAVKAGRKVEGMVAVVDGTEWADAYFREFGDDGEEDTTNAFVEHVSRNIWIHKNRGNAGTIIHEGVHKYTVAGFIQEVGFQFNEGVTEYFTRKVTDALNYRRGNYESNYQFSKKFVEYMGEDMVAKAYFDGDVATLKKKFRKKGKSWTTLKTKVKNKQWGAAAALLTD